MTKLSFVLLIACLIGIEAQAQDSPIEKNSISLNLLGTGSYIGISYERLLYERVSVEFGLGLIGYGIGGTVYPLKKVEKNQFNPFVGIKYTDHAIVDGENKSATYLPVGLTYFSNSGMNISLDVGPSYFKHKSPGIMPSQEELGRYPYSDYGIWGNLKLGFRF